MMEWWDDEPELLGETLGMLAAWQGDTGLVNPGSQAHNLLTAGFTKHKHAAGEDNDDVTDATRSPTSSSDSDQPWPTPHGHAHSAHTQLLSNNPSSITARGRCINVSRERRKQELEFLRHKVADLQGQLGSLRGRRDALLRPHYRDPHKRELVTTAPVWENMATRQFKARKKSELRNVKLKMLLKDQVRVAEDLLRVMQRAYEQDQAAKLQMQLAQGPVDLAFRLSRDQHRARLAQNCAHYAEAFAASSRFEALGPLRLFELQITHDDDTGVTLIDMVSSHVLPFSVTRVEDVMWRTFKGETAVTEVQENDTWEQTMESTEEDELAVDFTSTSTMGGAVRGTMTGKWLIKRFGAPDMAARIFVSHSFTDPHGFQNALDAACVDDDSWVRLVDAHTLGHTHLPQPLTVIQHVQRNRIAFGQRGTSTAELPSRSQREKLAQWFADQLQDELGWAQQTVENTLVDEALRTAVKQEARR